MDTTSTLLEIQSIDLRKAQIKKQIQSIPLQKKEAIAGLKSDKAAYEELNAQIKELDKENRRISDETEKMRQHKVKILTQSGETKDNATYTKLIEESKNCDAKIDDLDGQFIEKLDQVQVLKDQKKVLAEKLKALLARIEQDLKDLDTRKDNLEKTLPASDQKRVELAKNIDPELLARYERVFHSKGEERAVVVAVTEDDSCGFCHLKLSNKDIASSTNKLGKCTDCGVFLYH